MYRSRRVWIGKRERAIRVKYDVEFIGGIKVKIIGRSAGSLIENMADLPDELTVYCGSG